MQYFFLFYLSTNFIITWRILILSSFIFKCFLYNTVYFMQNKVLSIFINAILRYNPFPYWGNSHIYCYIHQWIVKLFRNYIFFPFGQYFKMNQFFILNILFLPLRKEQFLSKRGKNMRHMKLMFTPNFVLLISYSSWLF